MREITQNNNTNNTININNLSVNKYYAFKSSLHTGLVINTNYHVPQYKMIGKNGFTYGNSICNPNFSSLKDLINYNLKEGLAEFYEFESLSEAALFVDGKTVAGKKVVLIDEKPPQKDKYFVTIYNNSNGELNEKRLFIGDFALTKYFDTSLKRVVETQENLLNIPNSINFYINSWRVFEFDTLSEAAAYFESLNF